MTQLANTAGCGSAVPRWSWAAGFALILAACGGGGGSGSGTTNPAPPAPTPTFSADLYPMATGDRRSWRVTEGAVESVRHERVGEPMGSGLLVRELTLNSFGSDALVPDSTTVLQRTANGLSELPGPDSDTLARALGPVELLRFGAPQGQSIRLVDRTVSADVNGDGLLDSVDLRVDSEFTGVEAVATPAGSFANAHRVRARALATVRLSGVANPVVIDQVSETWYAQSMGPVRRTLSSRVDNAAPELSTEELLAYRVGSLRSEEATPTVQSSTPANGTTTRPDITLELHFSRPLDPLSLIGDAGLSLLRDGRPVVVRAARMDPLGRGVAVLVEGYPLQDGQYEMRHGGQVTDWAGNPFPNTLLRFQVDTTGPRLLASTPAEGTSFAARTGRVELRFNEPLLRPVGAELNLWLRADDRKEEWLIPATVEGAIVHANLPAELRINTLYTVVLGGTLTDDQGNPAAMPAIAFRTEPGPLSRPELWWPDGADVVLRLGDLDGDGRSDLVALGQSVGSDLHRVVVRRQRASGGFEPTREVHSLTGVAFERKLALGDLDGDGRTDVVGALQSGGVVLLRQRADGSGAFDPEPVPNLDESGYWMGQTVSMATGGSTLVWRGLSGLQLWRRDGPGAWRQVAAWPAEVVTTASMVTDLDGDGRQDFAWVQANATNDGLELAWRLQAADGGWSATRRQALPLALVSDVLAGDLNQDQRTDLSIAGQAPDGTPEVIVLRADGSGAWTAVQRLAHAFSSARLGAGDLDGDGRTDLVVTQLSMTGVYLQGTSGQLDAVRNHEAVYSNWAGVVVVDLNGDGRQDIVQGAAVLLGRAHDRPWPQGLGAVGTAHQRPSWLRPLPRAAERLRR